MILFSRRSDIRGSGSKAELGVEDDFYRSEVV